MTLCKIKYNRSLFICKHTAYTVPPWQWSTPYPEQPVHPQRSPRAQTSCKFQHYDLSASQVGPHTLKENIHNIIYIYTRCFLWPRVLNKLSESSIWWVLIRTFGSCCGVFLLHSDSCKLIRDVHDDQRMQRYTNAARGARKHRVGRTTGTRRLINLHRWILLNAHHRPN